ncbi:unnamed protein product [Victoria cruziana]
MVSFLFFLPLSICVSLVVCLGRCLCSKTKVENKLDQQPIPLVQHQPHARLLEEEGVLIHLPKLKLIIIIQPWQR